MKFLCHLLVRSTCRARIEETIIRLALENDGGSCGAEDGGRR